MNADVVLFDLDGTLANTIPAIAYAFNEVLKEFSYDTYDVTEYKNFVGGGFYNLFDRINKLQNIKEDKEFFVSKVRKVYAQNMLKDIKLYNGIDKLLDTLVENKVKIGIVTNKDHNLALEHTKTILSKWNFDFVIGASEQGLYPTKPNSYGINLVISKGYTKEKIVFIGDMSVDYMTAQNAGVRYIHCTWGYDNKNHYKEYEVSDVDEIIKRLHD
ncbi:HAD family hydrolase [Caviibacter abscessus]|uniref:HAD family hydrolase n=1 Tax=Caviibacter abscessus TaxID=1766719 RepID=UPI0008347F8A|nr:HAD family hydrolase [Caviibacter abscessus]